MKLDETFANIIKHDLATNSIPMLLGEPGIGKSSWVEALARDMKTKSFTLACNQLADKSDLTGARLVEVTKEVNGKLIKTGDYTQTFFPHVVITQAINYALDHPKETPILFLDELNRTTSDVTSEALSIPTMRSIGNRKLPTNLRVITAGNDKGNVVSLDTASISRFVLYHVEPDIDTFFAIDQHLNADIRTVLTQHPEYIFKTTVKTAPADSQDDDENEDNDTSDLLAQINDGDKLEQITTPRTLTSLSNWLNSYTDQELTLFANNVYTDSDGQSRPFLMDIVEAHTGKTEFSAALCDELIQRLNKPTSAANPANDLTMTKPAEFDQLKQAGSVQDLDALLANLSENQLERNFIYALYDQDNNADIIAELVQSLPNTIDGFNQGNISKLFKLSTAGRLNSYNVEYLCKLDNQTAKNLAILEQIS